MTAQDPRRDDLVTWRDRLFTWRNRLVVRPWGLDRSRDILAAKLVNLVLRTVATKHYHDFIAGAITYGLNAAARDDQEKRGSPGPWQNRVSKSAVSSPPCLSDGDE